MSDGDAVVLEAPNCGQAMQLISEHPDIGLILLDLNLPNRDGFTAPRQGWPGHLAWAS